MSPKSLEDLQPVHRRAAGIDVGSAENYVALPAEGLAPGESPVRIFGVFSAEQDALVEWLQQHQVRTVAMEATGIYWLCPLRGAGRGWLQPNRGAASGYP